jgi:deoxyribodipyrimidine photo-lyase
MFGDRIFVIISYGFMADDNQYSTSIFIFRRDLRLEDNRGLLAACKHSKSVIPVFIFDPRQANPDQNDYYSQNAFRFMCDSLLEVDTHLKNRGSRLHVLSGEAHEEVKNILAETSIQAVYVNADYTPFSIHRDQQIRDVCAEAGVEFKSFTDVCLNEPGDVLTNAGSPYKVFTPFKNKAMKSTPEKPRANNCDNFGIFRDKRISGADVIKDRRPAGGEKIFQSGGRKKATDTLNRLKKFGTYDEDRNTPAIEGTTGLSAHLKFGTISPREFYWSVRSEFDKSHGLINEIYWRDFYLHVTYHFPEVIEKSANFSDQFEDLDWKNDESEFTAWKAGETGFPFVDAGMRQLKKSGWMHNRVRMATASFLTKDLWIDWRWGEKHFAKHLVDYDPSSNNGGWQWAASTGADAQPYFRIFNPWTQGQDHDPNAEYIKEWVPELRDVSAERIHKIEDEGVPEEVDYPEAMVDHNERYHKTKDWLKQAKK